MVQSDSELSGVCQDTDDGSLKLMSNLPELGPLRREANVDALVLPVGTGFSGHGLSSSVLHSTKVSPASVPAPLP